MLYGIERGIIEFFRGDPGRTMLFHDSVSLMQVVSVGLILTGAFLWWRGLHRKAPIRPCTAATAAARRAAGHCSHLPKVSESHARIPLN